MAPHLTLAEQDSIVKWKAAGNSTPVIHTKIKASRQRIRVAPLDITVVRRFLKGKTHRRGVVEKRGRKRSWTRANVLKANAVRKDKIKKHPGKYIKWDKIVKGSRVPQVHRSTAQRAFEREQIPVKFRPCREKPQLKPEHVEERQRICGTLRRKSVEYFCDEIDMIMDNKMFPTPTTQEGRLHVQLQRKTGNLRTPGEGLQAEMTKPNAKRHRKYVGGYAHVCAGVSGGKIIMWEYYSKWNGKAAADMYRGPILSALKKQRGMKDSYLIAEDNDPTGFKSGLGIEAKAEVGIHTIKWPRYSPDLMPLDYSLWDAINNRMDMCAPKDRESKEDFKKRLRRVAFRLPAASVRKAVKSMKKRAAEIWKAGGKHIAMD